MLEDRLDSLLLAWDEQQLQGRDLSAAELCRDYPELTEELSRRIAVLRRVYALMQPGDAAPRPACQLPHAAAAALPPHVGYRQAKAGPQAIHPQSTNTDHNLLFGILALQMDCIGRDELITAMNAWVLDKAKPLAQILVDQGALTLRARNKLEAVVELHLEMHEGDPQKSLATVSSIDSVRQALQDVADPELHASLLHLSAARQEEDPRATQLAVGQLSVPSMRFRILHKHAEGGLGAVFVAHDEELHRQVALKEIKDRFAAQPESRSRFLLEAEVTGRLEHPGIVPVYGLGCYPDGRPFYAMRFIKGDSLRDAIQRFHAADGGKRDLGERSLAFRELLGRFVNACNALAYAHSRGVLHRDLKPHNIMLGKYGETLVVDWGLAKVIGSHGGQPGSEEGTLRPLSGQDTAPTQAGTVMGTPAYMSPEQAAGQLEQLGPASDIYSLGATLYELLCGTAPVHGQSAREIITKVQQGNWLPPRQIKPDVPRALEAICLKAMALKPEDRYPTALLLAQDVEHWLGDEPVAAYHEPWPVRIRRWCRRHRPLMAGVAALLLAAVPLSLIIAVNREQARQQAETDKREIARQKDIAQANEKAATAREAETKAVLDFVENRIFAAARPENQEGGLGHAVTLRRAIEAALPYVAKNLNEQPLIAARLRLTLGKSFQYLGEAKTAAEQFEAARTLYAQHSGSDHADTLRSMMSLATSYNGLGRYADALRLHEQTLQLMKAKLGPDHPDTLSCMNNLAESYFYLGRVPEALKLHEETLALRKAKLGPEHPDTLGTMLDLAFTYYTMSRFDDALKLNEETLGLMKAKLGPNHPDTLYCMGNLAVSYSALGRHTEALKLNKETLALRKAKLGPEHPDTLSSMNGVADSYAQLGQYAEALKLFEETVVLRKAKLGPDHLKTLLSMSDMANCYAALGRHAEALKLRKETLALRKKKLGPTHFHTLGNMNDLAESYVALGRRKELEQIHKDFYEDLEHHYQQAIQQDASNHMNWYCEAPLLLHRGDVEGYCRICREMLARFSETDKPEIADRTAKTCLLRPGAVSDLGPVRQLADRAATGMEQHLYYPWFPLTQGMADYRAGDFANAITRLSKTLSLVHDPRYRARNPTLAGTAYVFLAMAHHQLGHAKEAQQALEQATQRAEQMNWKTGWDDWLRFRLLYREAEELLRSKPETLK